MSAFNGISGNMPGWTLPPTSSNLNLTSPGISSTSWFPQGANSNNAGIASFLNFGEPPASASHYANNNDLIQMQHVIRPWHDGSHMHMAEYQPVFCVRQIDQQHGMYTEVTLGKLNQILRESYAIYKEVLATNQSSDATRFQNLLNKHGEDILDLLRKYKNEGDHVFENFLKGNELAAELREFYKLSTHKILEYVTKVGIMHKWNFLGVILNVNRSTSIDESSTNATEDRINVVNTVMAKRAFLHNMMGTREDSVTGADVWLVLRRVYERSGNPGHFEFAPYVSRTRIFPPKIFTTYQDNGPYPNDDATGFKIGSFPENEERRTTSAHVIPVGVITEPAARDGAPGLVAAACGSIDGKLAFEASASLPKIMVQVGM